MSFFGRIRALFGPRSPGPGATPVHVDDPQFSHYYDIAEVPPHVLAELKRFFLDYKVLEEKEVVVDPFAGRDQALKVIRQALVDYEALRAKG